MARLGLEPEWKCIFANDLSEKKALAYRANFADADEVFRLLDIKSITIGDLPQYADLAWGSFPCQDLSLAGYGKGLAGARSGLIWKLLELISELRGAGRAPSVLVFENVSGLVSSRGGDDLRDIMRALQELGYLAGTLSIDASRFLPQSRQRLFIVAALSSRLNSFQGLFVRDITGYNYSWTTTRLTSVWRNSDASTRHNWGLVEVAAADSADLGLSQSSGKQ